ncbi:MAG TPA: DUF1499 domain-containing protein [Thermoanaerobaculia bacterium]|jgi:uncharacterized protein (DUF1499 family)|nr:DUF1499 domain-containing protein [Thermoanaerobaculia bacterium]
MNSSLVVASAAVLTVAASVVGTRAHWFPFRTGLALFALSGLLGAIAVVMGVWALRHGSSSGVIAAIIIGALVMLPPAFGIVSAMGKPMIHDISTDLTDPPRFETLAVAPYDPTIASIQRKAYPDVQPIVVASSPSDALNRARAIAEENGWEIASSRPDALEATATTGWFAFKDDVIVRVRPADGGSRVDVRSVSRVGKSDVGVNAKRIRAFVARF